jgi:hypothetical protein
VRYRCPARRNGTPFRRRPTVRSIGRCRVVRGYDRLELDGQQLRIGPHVVEGPLVEPSGLETFEHTARGRDGDLLV